MTKRQIIDEILELNRSADPGFLASFEIDELQSYLGQLHKIYPPKLRVTRNEPVVQTIENRIADMTDEEIDQKLSQVLEGIIAGPQLRVVKPSNHNLGSLDMDSVDSGKNWLF